MATTLNEGGVPVLLVDTFPGALKPARQRGLPVLQAEILSEHGEEELTGVRVDYVFAATPDDIYNNLVCARLAPELGRERALQLSPESHNARRRTGISREARGKILGVPPLDYDSFEARHEARWRFAILEGTEALETEPRAVQLLAIHGSGALSFASPERTKPRVSTAGDRLLTFVPPHCRPSAREPAHVARPGGEHEGEEVVTGRIEDKHVPRRDI